MPLSTDTILAALRHVRHPRTGADIVTMGCVRDVAVAGSEARFTLALPPPAGPLQDQVRMTAEAVARAIPGGTGVAITVTTGTGTGTGTGTATGMSTGRGRRRPGPPLRGCST